jgi:hypothetical protein
MKQRCAIALLLLASVAYAKDKAIENYPLTVRVTQAFHGGDCTMNVTDGTTYYAISSSSTGSCVVFNAGESVRARRTSFLGVPMMELAWVDKNGKVKTCKYFLNSESQ